MSSNPFRYTGIARRFFASLCAATVGLSVSALSAADITSQPLDVPTSQPEAPKPAKPSGPYKTKAWGARLEPQPPSYVKTLDKFGFDALKDMDWLEFGAEHRTRFELRDDDLRRARRNTDAPFYLRSRGYVGVQKILDPVRFGLEFLDARLLNSKYPETTSTTDENEILQMFLELYFPDALGKGEPFRFQFGRMTFDYIDRRLVSRTRWGNVSNAFDGFRLRLGEASSDWQVDFFATQPVERFLRKFDHGDDERWFYGLIGSYRGWNQYVTIEPYWFVLDEDRKLRTALDREIHTMGLHLFGPIGKTGLDYDTDNAFQFGDDGARDHCAYANYSELGYTLSHEWKPRVSVSSFFATGDNNSADKRSERFDRLFAANHPWSINDYFSWQNVVSGRARLELQPHEKVRFDTAYASFWLATDDDAWVIPARRSSTGRAGEFIGQELEARVRYQIDPRVELELGYSHFMPGEFVRRTGSTDDTDFFYVQTTIRF